MRSNVYLSDSQISVIREKLHTEREKLVRKEQILENFCLDKNELSDVLDEANVNTQAQKELRFRNREVFYQKKIVKALDRIQNGIYGICDDCDGEISFERLLARPTAELCITCKEESELSEQNNFHQRKSKSYGKTLSELATR